MGWRTWLSLMLGLLAVTAGPAQQAERGEMLLEERFENNSRSWRVDDYSRFEDGGYLIDARNQGGYYRWIEEPAGLRDFVLRVELQKRRGNNEQPLYGVIFRIQDSWRNCYFFVINGAGSYLFGRFQQGSATVLKQGTTPALRTADGRNTLIVRANDTLFGLAVNDTPLANVVDETFPNGGRVGLCVEAPALVWFDNLQLTDLAGTESGPEEANAPDAAELYRDDFAVNSGWAVDEFRRLKDGAYHLSNQGQSTSYLSWLPKTAGLSDFVATIDVRAVEVSAKALFGLVWRLRDDQHFYFLLIGVDGRFYAGLVNGEIKVLRKGRQVAIRPLGEVNTLTVRAAGSEFTCAVNGTEVAAFSDRTYAEGSLGVYLEQPGHVAFDDLRVTALPQTGPPVVGGGAVGGPWPAGQAVLHDSLASNNLTCVWPTDAEHAFDQGGYCVKAPAAGSRTVIHQRTINRRDGVYQVNVRPVQGNLTSSYGLVVRASAAVDEFHYLLLNASGRYFVGRCHGNRFENLDSGPIGLLRGGDVGDDRLESRRQRRIR
ncbi:MAG: hypothetical protein HUU35_14785, partial [Armatimonadetes bacterium]|nr:hypothetical protein [Armatimonadota bacterium]